MQDSEKKIEEKENELSKKYLEGPLNPESRALSEEEIQKMQDLEKFSIKIPCPGGGNDLQTTLGELAKKRSIKSSKGEFRFGYSYQNKLKRTMKNVIKIYSKIEKYGAVPQTEKEIKKAHEELMEVVGKLLANADVSIKG